MDDIYRYVLYLDAHRFGAMRLWVISRPYVNVNLINILIPRLELGMEGGDTVAGALQARRGAPMNRQTPFMSGVMKTPNYENRLGPILATVSYNWDHIISDRSFRGCHVFPTVQ